MQGNNAGRRYGRLLCFITTLLLAPLAVAQQQGSPPAEADGAKAQAERQISQPLNNAPFYREVRKGENPYQTSQVRGIETNILVQPQGQFWRELRNGPVTIYGGWLFVLAW